MVGDHVIERGWAPGALGWVIAEHGRYYASAWQFGADFEAKVAEAMGEWMRRYDPARDLFATARDAEGWLGAISLDGSGPDAAISGARLRFFILAERARGRGIGKALMADVMAFLRKGCFDRAYLTTFAGLGAARKLYEDHGFTLVQEAPDRSWGRLVLEQRFEWRA